MLYVVGFIILVELYLRVFKIYSLRFLKLHILEKNLFQKDSFLTFSMYVLLINCKLKKT